MSLDFTSKNEISNILCGKELTTSFEECFQTKGRNNPLCRENKACRIVEKSNEQITYVTSSIYQHQFLGACPGSGKTEVVGLKSAYEIAKWDRCPGGIAVLTFTNHAADVISQRLSQFLGVEKVGFPHFVNTIDSWLQCYIANPFAHRITGYSGNKGDYSIRLIDSSSKAKFLNSFSVELGHNETGPVLANQFYYGLRKSELIFSSGNKNIDKMRQQSVLNSLQAKELLDIKKAFLKKGFCTYDDVRTICISLLSKYDKEITSILSKRFPLILIDECQDLSLIELKIFEKVKNKGAFIHLIGDIDQAIYEFKNVKPEIVKDFIETNSFKKDYLNNNYRSCQSIVDVCGKLVGSEKKITGMYLSNIEKPVICKEFKKDEISDLPKWFESLLDDNGIDVSDAVIITRNWSNVSKMRPSDNSSSNSYQKHLAMAIHLWKVKSSKAMNDSLICFGHFLMEKFFNSPHQNSKKYYCPDFMGSSVGWRQYLFSILEIIENEYPQILNLEQTWSEWIPKVRPVISDLVSKQLNKFEDYYVQEIPTITSLDGTNFQIPKKSGDKYVSSSLSSITKIVPRVMITTIHSVKGQTFEAVLVVSLPTKQGTEDGHWSFWLKDSSNGAARLAYVASSRPRKLLAWAVPELKKDEKAKLEKIGFEFC